MLEFDDPGEIVIVRVVHLHRGLEVFLIQGLRFEAQRAVGQRPVAVVEVFIDRPGVNQMPVAQVFPRLPKVSAELQFDLRVREDFPKHRGVTLLRQRLEFVGQIAIVAIRADRDAATDAGVEILRIELPLFARVVLKEHLVEPLPDLRDDRLLGVARTLDRLAPRREGRLHFLGGGGTSDELLKGVEIDRELPVTAFGPGEDPVFDRMPFGKLAEVIADAIRVRAEVVRSVGVDEHARGVVVIVRVTGDMLAAIEHETGSVALAGQAFGEDCTGVTGPDDQVVPGNGSQEVREMRLRGIMGNR